MDVAAETALCREALRKDRSAVPFLVTDTTPPRNVEVKFTFACAAAPRRRSAIASRGDLCSSKSACCHRRRPGELWLLQPLPRQQSPQASTKTPPHGHREVPVARRDCPGRNAVTTVKLSSVRGSCGCGGARGCFSGCGNCSGCRGRGECIGNGGQTIDRVVTAGAARLPAKR